MKKFVWSFVPIIGFLATVALAQNLDKLRSVATEQGNISESANKDYSSFRPISSWIGERFVFLEIPHERLRKLGYKNFQVGDELYECPDYRAYVGKITEVVSYEKCHDHWEVEFQMQDGASI